MIPSKFKYHNPTNLDEVLKLLSTYEEAKILAGGHSILPMMKLRFAEPAHLIDINGIDELKGVSEENGVISIGAMTYENDLISSTLLQEKCPLVVDVGKLIADPTVRNLGTIGGDIVHGDPGNDHPSLMLALNAEFMLQGPDGNRTVAADNFFHGTYWNEMASNEILTKINVSAFDSNTGYGFNKLKRKAGDFATAAAVVVMKLEGGVCSEARIALTNLGSCSFRAKEAENILTNQTITEELINQAATKVMEECDPVEDLRGSIEYKKIWERK